MMEYWKAAIGGLAMAVAMAMPAAADVAFWNAPGIDVWTYPSPQTPGVRTLGPTFLTSPGLDEFDQFLPSSSRDPARRGMSFAVFNTSEQIATELARGSYLVDAVTVTFTMQESTAGFIEYDDTHDTNAELLEDYVTGDIDTARPMELFGVALQADYTGFSFDGGNTGNGGGGELPYVETTYPYSPSDASGVLVAYPISSSESGEYLDASNSITGGYSATAVDNFTDPFDAVPWSVGTADGLTPGDVVPDGTTFSFALDLELPGVAEYVQQGLSTGALGFYLSSLHFSGDPHNGGTIPYPQWYLKEFNPLFGGVAPTLEVDYSIATGPMLPGDYNENGIVDSADYVMWRNQMGSATSLPNDDTPGVGEDDYTRWKTHYGMTFEDGGIESDSAGGGSLSVPEPSTRLLACCGLLALGSIVHPARRSPRRC
jgi:hypothetical protein